MTTDTYAVIGSLSPEREATAKRLAALETMLSSLNVTVLTMRQYGQWTTPRGFPAVYNQLLNAAFADVACRFCWILGDDVRLPPEDFLHTMEVIRSDGTIGEAFPTELWRENGALVTMLPFSGRKATYGEAAEFGEPLIEQIFAGMAAAVIRREAWEAVRPIEAFGLGYSEDVDVSLRCWRAGFRVVNDRRAFFEHERGATYNALVKEGVMDAQEPYRASAALKKKWPFMWEESAEQIMERLRKWYQEALEHE